MPPGYVTNMPIAGNRSIETPRVTIPASRSIFRIRCGPISFIAELDQRYKSGKEALPQFIYVTLPNDQTSDERPNGGYPYASSWVADNDLALGRILEYLSAFALVARDRRIRHRRHCLRRHRSGGRAPHHTSGGRPQHVAATTYRTPIPVFPVC